MIAVEEKRAEAEVKARAKAKTKASPKAKASPRAKASPKAKAGPKAKASPRANSQSKKTSITKKTPQSAATPAKQGERNKQLGRRGEDAAALYLARRGYIILERNWTCYAGEADIIASDGNALVFVEVKTRTSVEKGFPAEAVGQSKRERYEKIALCYLSQFEGDDMAVRFDVISIVVLRPTRAAIRHHINAFSVA